MVGSTWLQQPGCLQQVMLQDDRTAPVSNSVHGFPRLAVQEVVYLLHGQVLQPLEGYNMTWLPC